MRVARHLGVETVFAVDIVPERRALAERWGAHAIDGYAVADVSSELMQLTGGRGPDSVIDAVGMEAHGQAGIAMAQTAVGLLPKALAKVVSDKVAIDRLTALRTALKSVRRGGTVSISGVYGGEIDPMPMMEMFDRGIQLRMGQAHVRRWSDAILPLLLDDADPLGCGDFATHHLALSDAPHGYEMFQKKDDGCIKVVLKP